VAEAPLQTASTISGIKMAVSIYPGLIFIFGVVMLVRYEINKKMELTIEHDLETRRK
jgi:Na+/melibiose symporter-like transporter